MIQRGREGGRPICIFPPSVRRKPSPHVPGPAGYHLFLPPLSFSPVRPAWLNLQRVFIIRTHCLSALPIQSVSQSVSQPDNLACMDGLNSTHPKESGDGREAPPLLSIYLLIFPFDSFWSPLLSEFFFSLPVRCINAWVQAVGVSSLLLCLPSSSSSSSSSPPIPWIHPFSTPLQLPLHPVPSAFFLAMIWQANKLIPITPWV